MRPNIGVLCLLLATCTCIGLVAANAPDDSDSVDIAVAADQIVDVEDERARVEVVEEHEAVKDERARLERVQQAEQMEEELVECEKDKECSDKESARHIQCKECDELSSDDCKEDLIAPAKCKADCRRDCKKFNMVCRPQVFIDPEQKPEKGASKYCLRMPKPPELTPSERSERDDEQRHDALTVRQEAADGPGGGSLATGASVVVDGGRQEHVEAAWRPHGPTDGELEPADPWVVQPRGSGSFLPGVGAGAEGVGCQDALWNTLLGIEAFDCPATASSALSYRAVLTRKIVALNSKLIETERQLEQVEAGQLQLSQQEAASLRAELASHRAALEAKRRLRKSIECHWDFAPEVRNVEGGHMSEA